MHNMKKDNKDSMHITLSRRCIMSLSSDLVDLLLILIWHSLLLMIQLLSAKPRHQYQLVHPYNV